MTVLIQIKSNTVRKRALIYGLLLNSYRKAARGREQVFENRKLVYRGQWQIAMKLFHDFKSCNLE